VSHHEFNLGLGTGQVFKTDGVSDLCAESTPDFLGDALGDGDRSNLSRLGTAELAPLQHAFFGEVLGHLCRLA
jgi:hypothetical protein